MRKVVVWKRAPGGMSRLVWVGTTASVDYWHEQWARLHLAHAVTDAERHPVLHQLFLRHSSVDGRVLEGGCGLGQWVAVLREAGRAVVGLDYDVKTLRTSRGEARGEHLPLLGGDVRALPFPDGRFDTYISLGVAEHFYEGPTPLLSEAHRVLRSGGHLLISVPYFNPLRRLRARVGAYPAGEAQEIAAAGFYQYAFRTEEFTEHLARAGFGVEEVVPFAATTGLREDLPFLVRRHRGASSTSCPAVVSVPAAQPTQTGSLIRGGRVLARQLVHSRPLCWCSGHMVLFVARRL